MNVVICKSLISQIEKYRLVIYLRAHGWMGTRGGGGGLGLGLGGVG